MIKRFCELSYEDALAVYRLNGLWKDDGFREAETVAYSYIEDDVYQTPYVEGYIGDRGEYIEVSDLTLFIEWICAGNQGVIPTKTYEYISGCCRKLKKLSDAINALADFDIYLEYVDDEIEQIADELKDDIEAALFDWFKNTWWDMFDEQFQFDCLRDRADDGEYDWGDVWVDTDTWRIVAVDGEAA